MKNYKSCLTFHLKLPFPLKYLAMQNFILDIVTYSNPWNGYQFRENVVMFYMTHGCITNEDLQLQQHLDYHIKGHLCLCHRSAIKKPLSPRSTLQMAKCHLREYIQAHPQFFSIISTLTSDWHRVRFWVCPISLEFPLPTLPMAAHAIFPLPFCGFCLSRILANHFGRNWIMLTLNHNSHNPTFLVSL